MISRLPDLSEEVLPFMATFALRYSRTFFPFRFSPFSDFKSFQIAGCLFWSPSFPGNSSPDNPFFFHFMVERAFDFSEIFSRRCIRFFRWFLQIPFVY